MDNTVGSLTQLQKSIIIGTILGDGYLRIVKGKKNAILEIIHSYKQKEYVDWKYEILKNISGKAPTIRKGNKERVAYRFYTKALPELTDLFFLFYKEGKKIIPDIILNPIILSVWYMDDGSKCRASDVYLNTQQFCHDDQKKILDILKEFGFLATLNRDKKYWRVRFLKRSLSSFKNTISQYIIPSMRYKIEL